MYSAPPPHLRRSAAMANPIQQGLKRHGLSACRWPVPMAAMANPIQQGLKLSLCSPKKPRCRGPQWLIQYNKD